MTQDAADALEALRRALAVVGLPTADPPDDGMRADLLVGTPDGRSVEVAVTATSVATEDQADRLVHWRGEGVVPILVAGEVPDSVRRALDQGGISWLDRRGHLRFTAPGCAVDADVPAAPQAG